MLPGFGRGLWALIGNRSGAAAIEFAFAVIGFLVFLTGTLEVSRAIWTSTALQFAVEQASRLVIANPAATDEEIKVYVAQQLGAVDSTRVNISIERQTVNGVEFLGVTGTYEFYPISMTAGGGWFTLSGRSRIPLST